MTEMTRTAHTFVDAHGVTIHYYVWEAAEPRAIVQLLHGVGEYATRYDRFARALVAAGYTVYADDHRGHGATGLEQWGGDHAKLGKLGPGGVRGAIAAIQQLTGIIREQNPELPLVLFGHSLGSLFAQKIIGTDADAYDAVVLSGTAYRTLTRMNGGDLNAKHKQPGGTGHEWLSRDPEVWAAFHADPLTFDAKVGEALRHPGGAAPVRHAEEARPRPADADHDRRGGFARRPEERADARRAPTAPRARSRM